MERFKYNSEGKNLNETILDCWRRSRQDDEDWDVVITVEGQEFKGHKLVLTSLSDYFKTMFKAGFKERDGLVELHNVSKKIFAVLLDFMYGDTEVFEKQNEDVLIDAIYVADMLLLDIFKHECRTFIEKRKTELPGKCYGLLLVLDQEEAQAIVAKICKDYLDEKPLGFEEISFKLASHSLDHLLESGGRDDNSIKILLNFILQWAYANLTVASDEDIKTLMKIVPFEETTMKQIGSFLTESSFLLNTIDEKTTFLAVQFATPALSTKTLSDQFEHDLKIKNKTTFRSNMTGIISEQFVNITDTIRDLGLSLWVVEYEKAIIVIKEYDFTQHCYRKTETLLGFLASRFVVSSQQVHLLKDNGEMLDVDRKGHISGEHNFGLLFCNVVHMHAINNSLYMLRLYTSSNRYQISLFDVVTKKQVYSPILKDVLPATSHSRQLIFSCKNRPYVLINGSCFKIKNHGLSLELEKLDMDSSTDDILLNELFWKDSEGIEFWEPKQPENQATQLGCSFWQLQNISSMYSVCGLSDKSIIAARNENHPNEIQLLSGTLRLDVVDVSPYLQFKSLGFVPLDLTHSASLVGVVLGSVGKMVK